MKRIHVAVCLLVSSLLTTALLHGSPAQAQSTEKHEKERLYSYIANWQVPRAKWAEYEKPVPANQKVLDQGLADGTLVGYGDDISLVHSADGFTHDSFWMSHSLAGLLKTLDAFEKLPATTGGVMASVTKHADLIFVSRHYDWKPGTYKDAYTHGSSYLLKPTAPDDAVDMLSKNIFEPLLQKLLADGTIVEYEVDVESIHTESPDNFWIFYITPTAEGLDKVNAALRDAVKANSLIGPSLDSMVDYTPHRDELDRTNATFK
jgi:hypothetical protein